MFDTAVASEVGSVLARLHDVVDELIDLPLTGLNGDEVLGVLRAVEAEHRRLAVVDHALIGEVEQRGLAVGRGRASTERLLRAMLRVSVGEAGARARAARDLGPRRGLSGEVLAPVFPWVAAAQAAGELSAAQARIITGLIDDLPDHVQVEHEEQVQQFLVEQARVFVPEQLSQARAAAGRDARPGREAARRAASGGRP